MNRAELGRDDATTKQSRGRGATLAREVTSHTASNRKRTPAAWRPRGLDIALALVVFVMLVGSSITGILDTGPESLPQTPLNIALGALASLPLIAVRRAPLAVFALTAGAATALMAAGSPSDAGIGVVVALYFLATIPAATRADGWLRVLTVVGAFLLFSYADRLDNPIALEPFRALFWFGAWYLGDWVRLRRERNAERERSVLRAEREAERERRLAVAEERTRIARDLHDSAGHAINVILVQAGAARLLSQRDPDGARRALETIEEVARATISEIDLLVRGLRDDGTPPEGFDPSEPRPGLAALDSLMDRNRAAGLDVVINVRSEHGMAPPGVDQAAYRILQEALTNAARHGRGSAEVEVVFGPRALELTVTNPTSPGWAPAGAGHGIVGMRERAALLGGSLVAAGGDGVFRVKAELPYGAERP